ncbi:MAG: hypothetical protein J6X18_04730 [Bacteroidales bacterium]|nr:hypothetical protein [Bacteroidales bacterium]
MERKNIKSFDEIMDSEVTEVAMLAEYKPRQHYKFIASLGRMFPTTKQQALNFKWLDVLGKSDVIKIEALLNKHGYNGMYVFTKSRTFCRLSNTNQFKEALKKEYKY